MTNQRSIRTNDALIPAIILFGSLTVLLLAILPPSTNKPAGATSTSTAAPTLVAVSATDVPPTQAAPAYDPALLQEGQTVFQSTCTTCHGMDGQGIQGLGKNLVSSEFVASLTDDELLQFIINGRDPSDPLNTTGIPMPARGGNPSLSDDQLMGVVAYIRSISSPAVGGQLASTNNAAVPTLAPATQVVEAVLPTSIPVTPQPFTAQSAFARSCSGCHGIDGAGNQPFGPSILDSDLFESQADLLAYITEGKPLADPRVEFPHPGRGGYPPLTDEELTQLIDYLRTLVTEQPAS